MVKKKRGYYFSKNKKPKKDRNRRVRGACLTFMPDSGRYFFTFFFLFFVKGVDSPRKERIKKKHKGSHN